MFANMLGLQKTTKPNLNESHLNQKLILYGSERRHFKVAESLQSSLTVPGTWCPAASIDWGSEIATKPVLFLLPELSFWLVRYQWKWREAFCLSHVWCKFKLCWETKTNKASLTSLHGLKQADSGASCWKSIRGQRLPRLDKFLTLSLSWLFYGAGRVFEKDKQERGSQASGDSLELSKTDTARRQQHQVPDPTPELWLTPHKWKC